MSKARKKKPATPLQSRWRIALMEAGIKQADWATANGWAEGHVSQVVLGGRKSEAVMSAVMDFIAIQEQKIAKRAAAS